MAHSAALEQSKSICHTMVRMLILLSCLLFLLWLCLWLLSPTTLPIAHVQVKGQFVHLKQDELIRHVAPWVRGGFFSIDMRAIQQQLLDKPWVEKVTVHRVWPDRLLVKVQERQAFARWGDAGVLTTTGTLFYPDRQTIPPNLPQLHGPKGSDAAVFAHFRAFTRALKPIGLSVVRCVLSQRHAWQLTLSNELTLYLGRSFAKSRLTRFVEVAGQSKNRTIDRLASVDLRYTNGFAVRLRKGS